MTEGKWLQSDSPDPMFDWLGQHMKKRRKFRLFACACCQRAQHLFVDPCSKSALEVAERFADGLARRGELLSIRAVSRESSADRAVALVAAKQGSLGTLRLAMGDARWSICKDFERRTLQIWQEAYDRERHAQAGLLLDIFGNPFRRVAFDLRWRTADVTALARGIYEERAFDRLPLLADALMDAGCDDEQIISHCRSDSPHVRGCWVVDLVLDKE
jgi:hypothetical protein